jgi:long-chain fatty acid transport protein
MTSITRISALAVGIAGALACAQAHAAAFQLKDGSAKAVGRAYSGEASAPDDASVVATNPAAMIGLKGTQFQADLSVIDFSAKFSGNGTYASGAPISGGNGGNAGGVVPDPSLYFHTPIGEKGHFGVSLSVPFGLPTEYDRDWKGRYQGVKTDLKAIDLGFAASYDVNPYVSFGVSVFAERLDIELTQAIDFGTALAANPQIQQGVIAGVQANPQAQAAAQAAGQQAAQAVLQAGGSAAQAQAAAQAAGQQVIATLVQQQLGGMMGAYDGFSSIKGNDTSVGFTLGTLLSPSEDTHIGIAYHSKVEHKITNGKAKYQYPEGSIGGVPVQAILQSAGYVDAGGKATISMPAFATISFTHDFGATKQWRLLGDVTRTAWKPSLDTVTVDYDSAQPDSELVFGYDDSTFASLGLEYKVSDAWTVRGGYGYDQTPTSDAHRDVRVPDETRNIVSLGFSWKPSERTTVDVGYSHLFVKDASINETTETMNTLIGQYKDSSDVLSVGVNVKF